MQETDLYQLLKDLYRDQLALKYDEYLHIQSRSEGGLRRRIDAFLKYKPYLKPGRILDWGCKHSVDGCFIRHTLGKDVTLLGCDTCEGDYEVFHRYANLEYTQLKHPYQLPYADNEFDAVICSGVLEHVPNDSESLKEIYRILKPRGRLFITFLPNQYSYTENILEWWGGCSYHQRRYVLAQAKRKFLDHGFVTRFSTYHQIIPSFSGEESTKFARIPFLLALIRFLFTFNNVLERIWVLRLFSSNLIFVLSKAESV